MPRTILVLLVVLIAVLVIAATLLLPETAPPASSVPVARETPEPAPGAGSPIEPPPVPPDPATSGEESPETRQWKLAIAHFEAGRVVEALAAIETLRKKDPGFLEEPTRAARVLEMEDAALRMLQEALDGGDLVRSRKLGEALRRLVTEPNRLDLVSQKLRRAEEGLDRERRAAEGRILGRIRRGGDRKTMRRHLDRFGPDADVKRSKGGDAVRPRLRAVADRNEEDPTDPLPVPDVDAAEARRLEQLEKLRRRNAVGLLDHIAAGLAWLALHQGEDGSFAPDTVAARCRSLGHKRCGGSAKPGRETAAAALAVIAFLDFRDQDTQGLFEPALARSVSWLLSRQKKDGSFAGGRVYQHALAVMALGQAAAVSGREDLRRAVERGLAWLATGPGPQGGYRYRLRSAGDLSATGWVAQAYEAAGLCDAKVPERLPRDLRRFWDTVWLGEAKFSYLSRAGARASLAPVGMLMADLVEAPSAGAFEATWRKSLVSWPGRPSLYTLYYGVRVLLAMDGKLPKKWNDWVFQLAAQQVTKGGAAGSIPAGKPFKLRERGIVIHTAFSVLTLEHSLYRR